MKNKKTEKYFKKLLLHLPAVKDPTVVILRGHLLAEELLDELIALHLKDTTAIKKARFTFFQKLCIAQGLMGKFPEWKSIKELNELRNKIGHKLPDSKLADKIDSILRTFFEDEFGDIPNDTYSKSKALRKGIIFQCAFLSGYIYGHKESLAVKNRRTMKKSLLTPP